MSDRQQNARGILPTDSDFWRRFNVVAANVVAEIEREGAVLTPADIRVIREATLLVILDQPRNAGPAISAKVH